MIQHTYSSDFGTWFHGIAGDQAWNSQLKGIHLQSLKMFSYWSLLLSDHENGPFWRLWAPVLWRPGQCDEKLERGRPP